MAEEKIKVDVQIDHKGNADSALSAMEQKVARLEAAEKRLQSQVERTNSAIERGKGRTATPAAGMGGGFGLFGGGGGVGLALPGPGKALAVLGIGLDKAANAADAMSNSMLTNAQKQNALITSLIPGADKIKKFWEALDGTTEKLRRNARERDFGTFRINMRAEREFAAERARTEFGGAQARQMAAHGTIQYAAMQKFDRGTVEGELRSEEQGRRMSADDAITRAKREAAAAKTEAAIEAENFNRGTERLNKLGMQRSEADKEVRSSMTLERMGRRNKAVMDTDLTRQRLVDESILKEEEAQLKRVEALKQRNLDVSKAESNVRKAMLEQGRAELDIAKTREQRMAAGQQRLGAMNKGQFELAKQAAVLLQKTGIENATPELIEAAQQAAPRMVGKMQEGLGEGRAKELAGLGIDDFATDFKDKTLKEVRAEVDRIQAEVRVNIDLDEKALAKDIADSISAALKDFVKAMEVRDVTRDRIKQTEERIRTNQQH